MTIFKAFIAAWSSRKLWAFIFTVSIIWIGYERAVNHLYSLPTEKCGTLATLTVAAFGIIGAAAGAYMGFQSRYSADSVATAISETITQVTKNVEVTNEDRI